MNCSNMATVTVTVAALAGGAVGSVGTADEVGADMAVVEGGAMTPGVWCGGVDGGEHPAVARPISITPVARTGIMEDPVLRSTRVPAESWHGCPIQAMPTCPFHEELKCIVTVHRDPAPLLKVEWGKVFSPVRHGVTRRLWPLSLVHGSGLLGARTTIAPSTTTAPTTASGIAQRAANRLLTGTAQRASALQARVPIVHPP